MTKDEIIQDKLRGLENLLEESIKALRTALEQPEQEQEPVAWTEREIELINGMIEVQLDHATRCDGIANRTMADKQKRWDTERVALLQKMKATPPAAQRPWQGLTDEEVQFYIEKHSKLVNAGYDKMTDTNLVAKTFDSTGFYKEVSTILKERNT